MGPRTTGNVTFQYKTLKTRFSESYQKGISTDPSESGIICKISSFRSPKMTPNNPKSSIFLDDVIDYAGSLIFYETWLED